jgi:methyl-accepting chemotaxis protein
MKIQTKLVAFCLVISLVPVSAVGVTGLQNMDSIGSYAQEQSTTHLEEQITGELNNTIDARQEEIQNLLNVRRVDARSLADSAPVRNYQAARAGEMELIQRQSQRQLGYTALQMRNTVESTKRAVLEEKYDGRRWEELSPDEKRQVKDEVEATLAGTSGDGVRPGGTMAETFRPGYIGDTGYAYVIDLDSNVVAHHSLEDGYNLEEDASLTVFEDVRADVRSNAAVRDGRQWGIAEYEWEDTTQEGNPTEKKFIAYAYHEDFDWVLSPSVYYYELQTTAVEDARDEINDSFRSYLNARSVTVDGEAVPAYEEVLLTDATGRGVVRAHSADGTVSTESVRNVSYAESDWFQATKTLEEGAVHVGDVRTVDGHSTAYVTTPVYRDGTFAGAVALRFNYSILGALTNDITVGDTGHLSIANSDGRVLTHSDEGSDGVDSNIASQEYVLAGERGLTTYTHATDGGEERRYYVGYAPLQFGDQRYELIATVPERDVTAPSTALGRDVDQRTTSARNVLLLLVGGIVAVVGGFGYGAARYFARPIERLRDRANELAAGRFDGDVDISAPDDEVGELVDAFDDMQTNLERQVAELRTVGRNLGEGDLDQDVRTDLPGEFGAIMADLDEGIEKLQDGFVEVQTVADQFLTMSNETAASAEEIESASQETARSVEEIARGAEKQTEQLQVAADEMNDLSATIEEVAASADGVVETTNQAVTLADQGREHAADATADLATIESEAGDAVEQVEELGTRVDEINEIVQLITDIAEQTDLLALNASIEAARAGEAGEGFAVVAHEIKSLANEAAEATEEVEDRIDAIQDRTDETVRDMRSMRASVESGSETIGDAIEMFDDISEAVREAEHGVTEISEATENQAVSTEEVVSMVDEVSSVSEETTSEASSVSAATEEQTAALNEVSQNVQQVSESARSLTELVGEFDVGDRAEVEDGDGDRSTDVEPPTADELSVDADRAAADGGGVPPSRPSE